MNHTDVAEVLGTFANHIYATDEAGQLLVGKLCDQSRLPFACTDKEAATKCRRLLTSVTIRPAEVE